MTRTSLCTAMNGVGLLCLVHWLWEQLCAECYNNRMRGSCCHFAQFPVILQKGVHAQNTHWIMEGFSILRLIDRHGIVLPYWSLFWSTWNSMNLPARIRRARTGGEHSIVTTYRCYTKHTSHSAVATVATRSSRVRYTRVWGTHYLQPWHPLLIRHGSTHRLLAPAHNECIGGPHPYRSLLSRVAMLCVPLIWYPSSITNHDQSRSLCTHIWKFAQW